MGMPGVMGVGTQLDVGPSEAEKYLSLICIK